MASPPLWLLLQLAPAHAACSFSQTNTPDAVEVRVSAGPGVIHCRTVTLTADDPLTLDARRITAGGRTGRLPADHVRQLPGGGWEVANPEMVNGDRLELRVALPAEGLTVRFGTAPAPLPQGAIVRTTWTYVLDPKHPAWGFADPRRATTTIEERYTFTADAPAQVLPDPDHPHGPFADPTLVPDGVRYPGGAGEIQVQWSAPGAAAQGIRLLPPGEFTLRTVGGDGAAWVTSADPTITVEVRPGEIHFTAPSGGEVRWRVARAGGEDVIPDAATFLAGLDWRFRKVSLPEPAVPVHLKGMRRGWDLFEALTTQVQDLIDARLPGADPLQPRSLNRAWRSGWATEVERALILQRFLGQERYPSRWAITGDHPDPITLTGYDTLLLQVDVPSEDPERPGRTVWLDPSCLTCAPGEISPRWQGRAALGAVDAIPRQPGHLVRRMRIVGTEYQVRYEATGAAALWLREAAADADPPRRGARLGRLVGAPDGTVHGLSAGLRGAWPEGGGPALLDAEEGVEIVELTDGHLPRPPFGPEETPPWLGGWEDAL